MPDPNPSVEIGPAISRVRRCWAQLLLALTLGFLTQQAAPFLVAADDQTPLKEEANTTSAVSIQHVEIGFAGRAKLGFFIPVSVTLEAREPIDDLELRITAPDSEGNACTWESDQRFSASPTAASTHVVGVRIGRRSGPVIVAAYRRNVLLAEYPLADSDLSGLARATQECVLSLGRDITLSEATRFRPQNQETELVSAHLASVAGLPTDVRLWEGLDAVLLTTSEEAFWRGFSPATWRPNGSRRSSVLG